ncbi:TIGR03757 family integrating conjugative element protein [Burkholderia sp. Bp9012]|uniref:TIGR03757 family integrating conjugative element protein n=1 Tax=Burkholderia sp. Bp9012 TaxID=2184562 RepID=UPI000F5B7710|nr:TIGR03757 family integrating conjugative element protein [Burkholderia sp. Bp9012]RQR79146.1 TIGR03757 family integrating conjugative element protein [Burkholderia sp. Bp9012]
MRCSFCSVCCLGLGVVVTMLGAPSPASEANAPHLIVFTDRAHPIVGASPGQVVWLDDIERIESQLSTGLPQDASAAAAEVQRRLQRQPGIQLQFASAYEGAVKAWHLGVAKLPAVVVDDRFVVYGDPDIGHAIARIAAYRSTHP